MQGAMEDFLRALRAADVKVSPVEAIDAHLTVATVGFADRELFKDALCATLAKTAAEVTRFDETFETFFARETFQLEPPPPPGEDGEPEGMPPEVEASELAQMLLNGDVSALAQAMEAAAERAQVSSIRLSTQRSRLTRRMMEEMGLSEIEQIIAAAKKLEDARSQALVARLESGKKALTEEAQRFVDRQHELYAAESGKNLREELLARKALNAEGGIDPADLVMMQALVKKMAKRLADRYSRRRSKAQLGHLDVRRTLRKSMAYGGMPFDIIWKTKKVEKPNIVAICDVSKSVAAAAQFLLTFLYSLNEVVDRMDAFAFSGRMISVNDLMDDNKVETAILEVLKKIGFQQTDYGKSLEDFCDLHLDQIDRHTTVIFLGDARSNYADPRIDLFATIQKRCRAMIWLNPEPESYWGQGDSVMHRYERFCHVAKPCNTLGQLERIIEDVLRTYIPH
ncbi:MAG: VWA domain-containing protein [Phenylobacterium sp.]|uniref:VWA domain-containing protein n=1 Tax=Phenylobacterium sp. TaxID=1871053 RepID=UPI0027253C0F|nr:VWA domain-containing protein [Phenylobacterium sp.]MDO8913476.1 VWA domain-containing protein [Phenylobacterium sp.]MDP3101847.1 VWA domain-containing protein [Phenylobacterium sp.]